MRVGWVGVLCVDGWVACFVCGGWLSVEWVDGVWRDEVWCGVYVACGWC